MLETTRGEFNGGIGFTKLKHAVKQIAPDVTRSRVCLRLNVFGCSEVLFGRVKQFLHWVFSSLTCSIPRL